MSEEKLESGRWRSEIRKWKLVTGRWKSESGNW
jgi:hypothetical protein